MRYIVLQGTKQIANLITRDNANSMEFVSIAGNLHQIMSIHRIVGTDGVKVMKVSVAYEIVES